MYKIIHLICAGIMGVMCYHLNVSVMSLEFWILTSIMIISYICGKYDNEGGK